MSKSKSIYPSRVDKLDDLRHTSSFIVETSNPYTKDFKNRGLLHHYAYQMQSKKSGKKYLRIVPYVKSKKAYEAKCFLNNPNFDDIMLDSVRILSREIVELRAHSKFVEKWSTPVDTIKAGASKKIEVEEPSSDKKLIGYRLKKENYDQEKRLINVGELEECLWCGEDPTGATPPHEELKIGKCVTHDSYAADKFKEAGVLNLFEEVYL